MELNQSEDPALRTWIRFCKCCGSEFETKDYSDIYCCKECENNSEMLEGDCN